MKVVEDRKMSDEDVKATLQPMVDQNKGDETTYAQLLLETNKLEEIAFAFNSVLGLNNTVWYGDVDQSDIVVVADRANESIVLCGQHNFDELEHWVGVSDVHAFATLDEALKFVNRWFGREENKGLDFGKDKPIGKTTNVRVENGKLIFEAELNSKGQQYQALSGFFYYEHDLLLSNSDLDNIIHEVEKHIKSQGLDLVKLEEEINEKLNDRVPGYKCILKGEAEHFDCFFSKSEKQFYYKFDNKFPIDQNLIYRCWEEGMYHPNEWELGQWLISEKEQAVIKLSGFHGPGKIFYSTAIRLSDSSPVDGTSRDFESYKPYNIFQKGNVLIADGEKAVVAKDGVDKNCFYELGEEGQTFLTETRGFDLYKLAPSKEEVKEWGEKFEGFAQKEPLNAPSIKDVNSNALFNLMKGEQQESEEEQESTKNIWPVYTAKMFFLPKEKEDWLDQLKGGKTVLIDPEGYAIDKSLYKWIKKDGQLIWWHPDNKKKPKIERGQIISRWAVGTYKEGEVIVSVSGGVKRGDNGLIFRVEGDTTMGQYFSRLATSEEIQLLGDRKELEVRFKKEGK